MPPVLIAFFVLVGGLVGAPLLKDAGDAAFVPWPKPAFEHRYLAWSSPQWDAVTRDTHCTVTFFAVASRRLEITTARAFAVDTSFTVDRQIPVDSRMDKTFVFSDPDTGDELARRRVTVRCRSR